MKIYRLMTRIVLLLLTSVFGLLFGVAAPLFIMDMQIEGLSDNPVLVVWLVFAVLGYFLPCVLFNLGRFKSAVCFAAIGTVLMLYMHTVLNPVAPDAGFMYLPQMFMTIFTVIYAVIAVFIEKDAKNSEEVKAPSVLGE